MIILNISSHDSANRMLGQMLINSATKFGLPKPAVKILTGTNQVTKFINKEALLVLKETIFITDDIKYASNHKKPHFCQGEVTSLEAENSFVIYLSCKEISSFFNPASRIHYEHICEKAVLLNYHLLPQFNFIYKPIYSTAELRTFVEWLNTSSAKGAEWLIGCDIETSNSLITCISYTLINLANPKAPLSFCVDLIEYASGNRLGESNIQVYLEKLALIRQLHSNTAIRFVFHNGTYDNSYLIKYSCPAWAYRWDTQYLFYSMHSLSRKALWHVSSSVNPMYKYWKEEIRGGEEDDLDVKESGMPHTVDGYKRYLRYCALDSFQTLTNLFYMLQLINFHYKWAPRNYGQIHRLNLIYMEMQFHSFPVDREHLTQIIQGKSIKSNKVKALFEYIFADALPNFNINSVVTKRKIFYDLLKADPVGGALSTDADTLSQLAKQHPLIEWFANKLKEYQENNKFVSDFGKLLNTTTISCKLNATGTITSRANAKATDFNKGRNLQNITAEIREAFVAPQGYLIADIDYSQADTYFVAASTDEKMFQVVTDDRDTHAVHASQVFGIPYEEVLAHKGDKHSARKLVKPISHGGNYFMTARTMYARLLTEIGTTGLQQMAERLGLPKPKVTKDFIKLCEIALHRYRAQYPKLLHWHYTLYGEQTANQGLISTAFGFTTWFPIKMDKEKVDGVLRQIAAYKGQGGTAGLMNRFLVNTYFEGRSQEFDSMEYPEYGKLMKEALKAGDFIPVVQVHDSIVFFIRETRLQLLDIVMKQMMAPINYNGHQFHVPVECEVGRFWSKRLMSTYKLGDFENFDLSKLHTLEERTL